MNREEFLKGIEEFQNKLGMWQIEIDKLCMGDFILGCYFDECEEKWKVYQNNERGRHWEMMSTTSEQEALEKLYSIIKFHSRTISH
ncbi:hypothetical protein SAMN02745134_03957 [Clostridium acidisoli DSM 12555]|jgi:hypothetical protein|uniref:Uncharacterized protein n=1 Tax=Clostridium acidisoli DSM 12555 TaxID=1121291 RepID=A0A1W1Y0E2_9CLOT|nr:hypothetical protein [Clostridium acidisoli]SMC29602.1 hypothetical protein SAMN02745134_03957 [Clostridium acidisoli DSM 12555]